MAVFSIISLLFVLVVSSEARSASLRVHQAPHTCKDVYIWIADGSVDCSTLEHETFWGLHHDPDHWCNHYVLTDCCETCNRLRQEGIIPGQVLG